MKKSHLQTLLVLSCTLLLGLGGCTTDYTNDDPQVLEPTDETVEPKTRSLENAVFNEGAQAWMVPQKDPYTLENFQQAYDNLLSGNTTQPLTRSEVASIANAEPLKATHYRLKIYPKTEAEEWKIERMEDVKVAYIPFDYVQLTKAESEKVAVSTRAQTATYPDNNPYSVTYEDMETNDGPADPVTFILPVLYVVWPCDKPLPEDMDYEIECEVFIPPYDGGQTRSTASTLSETVLQRLENEAISLALDIPVRPITRASRTASRTLRGKVSNWDTYLKKRIPIGNFKQRFQLGSNIWETYTQMDGTFSITAPIPDEAIYYHVFQHSRWKVTDDLSTSPTIIPWCEVNYKLNWPTTDTFMEISPGYGGHYDLQACIAYYYGGLHGIRTSYVEGGLRIIDSSEINSSANASFHYNYKNELYIIAYKNNLNNQSLYKGSFFHEIGHFTQYGERGGYSGYTKVHKFIRESFGSFVGWYIGELFYTNAGYIKLSRSEDITGQARQQWTQYSNSSTKYYSPLFVDMVDNYNQYYDDERYNNDPIQDVPYSIIILRIVSECTTWSSVKNVLQEYVGAAYPQSELDKFLVPYDYWFAHN